MKKSSFVLMLLMAFCFTSCMTTKTTVGNFSSAPGQEYVYDKGKQCYLFWGLLPLGRKHVSTPPDGNCEVRTRLNFWDGLVSLVTAGIFDMQSIRVYAKPNGGVQTETPKPQPKEQTKTQAKEQVKSQVKTQPQPQSKTTKK